MYVQSIWVYFVHHTFVYLYVNNKKNKNKTKPVMQKYTDIARLISLTCSEKEEERDEFRPIRNKLPKGIKSPFFVGFFCDFFIYTDVLYTRYIHYIRMYTSPHFWVWWWIC